MTKPADVIKVVQVSDTHFSTGGRVPYGGAGYDPMETFDEVLERLSGRPGPDLTVVTGDIADHGEPAEYEVAFAQLSRLAGEVYLLPGNHDHRVHLAARVPADRLRLQRTLNIGEWLFVFADSNGDYAEIDEGGRLVDGSPDHRGKGIFSERELAWLSGVIASSSQPHVFVWVHHPPGVVGGFSRADYVAQVKAFVDDSPRIRGFGSGHAHTDLITSAGAAPVYICPSLTTSIDFEAGTTMPPGFREYDFYPDGRVEAETILIDDPRWNGRPKLPDPVISWLMGEIDADEMKSRLRLS